MSGATKRQIMSRFRRAITYASNLVEVVEDQSSSKSTNQDVLEAKAYLYLLKGGLDFERNRWSSCLRQYGFVRLVYTALATHSQTTTYDDILEGTIDPSIRYAAYQAKLPRTKAVSDIAIENFPTDEAEARKDILEAHGNAFQTSSEKIALQAEGATDVPTQIQWRGRMVKLEDASISQALAIADVKQEAIKESFASFTRGSLSAKDLAVAYDDIINARQEAVDATKTVIDELLAEGLDQSDSRVQGLQVIRTAVNYAVIAWRIGRSRLLCGDADGLESNLTGVKRNHKSGKGQSNVSGKEEPTGRKSARLRERVALYDSILQNLEAVKQLPGVIADTVFVKELDSKRSYFRALKCLAIGRSYAINSQVKNALALFARAQGLSSHVQSSTSGPAGVPQSEITADQAKTLQTHLRALVLQYRALADLENDSKERSGQDRQYVAPLLERLHLNHYDENVNLKNVVNYPPTLQPIPMKPLFFDLAWDYIRYPWQKEDVPVTHAASEQQSRSAREEETPKKRGWFGFGR